MTDQSRRKESELRALAYFVVGVSSEGSLAGKDVSNRLSFAGAYRDGKMIPVQKSGLSIGTLQKDLGQDRQATAVALVEAYQEWAKIASENHILSGDQHASLVSDLSRDGDKIREQDYRPIDSGLRAGVDTFLRSDRGRDFVHQRDRSQIDRIYAGALSGLAQTPAYEHASPEGRIKLAAVTAKAFNQNEVIARRMLRKMSGDRPEAERLNSFDDVKAYTDRHFSAVMRDGRDAALRGADVYNRLQKVNPQNPLHHAWNEVLKDPLIKPSLISQDGRSSFPSQYTTIKNLFLEPVTAKSFIDAVERGADYSRGSPKPVGNRGATSGFFASGTNFVQWNADGKGVAYSDGSWSPLSRDDVTRTRLDDGSIDLSIRRGETSEPLLHVGPSDLAGSQIAGVGVLRQGANGRDVSALQSQLAELGFTDARGRALRPDGDFGASTHAAVQAFQRDHHLNVDGVAGPETKEAVREAVRMDRLSFGQPNASYMDAGHRSEAMSPYRALMSKPASDVPFVPAMSEEIANSHVDVSQAAAMKTSESHGIRTLQENLNTLGVSDVAGNPVAVTGIYDMATQTAVARFQSERGIAVTGQEDEATRSMVEGHAYIADLQQAAPMAPREASASPHREGLIQANPLHSLASSRPSQLAQPLADPRHPESPNHQLYNELQRHIPEASEARLLQFTAACHKNMITADNLSTAYVDEERMTVELRGSDPLATPAQVDLRLPSPKPEEAIQQIQQFDQQEMQLAQAYQTQQAQSMQQGRSM